jgi:hypothetical protein
VDQAIDEIYGLLFTAWRASFPTAVILFPDVDGEPPASGVWSRVVVQHTNGGQAALAGGLGLQMWDRSGVVGVQVFSDAGRGMTGPSGHGVLWAASVMRDALEGAATTGNVWFTNVKLVEVGRDGNWQQVNVTASFEYQQLK